MLTCSTWNTTLLIMPIPAAALAAIPAVAGLTGNFTNAASGAFQNWRSRKWSENMYERQRDDGLEFWRMQNEYNSPSSQMQRFTEAGLNPNLIYGRGDSGNAGSIPVPQAPRPEFNVSRAGDGLANIGATAINMIYDLEMKQAQTDNLRAQNTVIQKEGVLKDAQTANLLAGTDRRIFDLDFEKSLASVSAEARRERLRQATASTNYTLNEDARRAALTNSNLTKAAEEMANMRANRAHTNADTRRIYEQLKLMKQDGTLKGLDIDLKKMGINPNSPTWQTVTGRLLMKLFEDSESVQAPNITRLYQLFK